MTEQCEIRSGPHRIRGVLTVPDGTGRFPCVILSHGLDKLKRERQICRPLRGFSGHGSGELQVRLRGLRGERREHGGDDPQWQGREPGCGRRVGLRPSVTRCGENRPPREQLRRLHLPREGGPRQPHPMSLPLGHAPPCSKRRMTARAPG